MKKAVVCDNPFEALFRLLETTRKWALAGMWVRQVLLLTLGFTFLTLLVIYGLRKLGFLMSDDYFFITTIVTVYIFASAQKRFTCIKHSM